MNKSTRQQDVDDQPLVCRFPEDARIVLVGLGGVGGALLLPLVIFLRSLYVALRLVLVDGDTFQPRDASRQAFVEVGNKAEVKAAETLPWLEHSQISVVAVDQFLKPDNIGRIIREGDFVLLCVDNHETRKLVSDHCRTLPNVTLVSGGNDGVNPPRERGTYGNVQIAVRQQGRDLTAPLTKYHPEIAQPKGKLPHEQGCGEAAPANQQIYVTNLAVASAMLNALFALICGRLAYQEVKFDILDARMLPQFELPVEQRPPAPAG
jgi:hypothetical protein